MLTKEQIEQAAKNHIERYGVWKVQSQTPAEEANAANFDFSSGAKWAIEQLQAENERLRADNHRLFEQAAALQAGNAILRAKIEEMQKQIK